MKLPPAWSAVKNSVLSVERERVPGVERATPGVSGVERKPFVISRAFIAHLPGPEKNLQTPEIPQTLPLLLPDLRQPPFSPDDFLFFDLETTGLSGGAGTVAFLAAFGRFVSGQETKGNPDIEITQFLLLDYPGESVFLEAVLAFLGPARFLVSYNGKAFDTQILKTRCLMNGIPFLPVSQLDLLHPSRRLWKRILPNCSQATIETEVLGLDRTGDTPGSLAPDIWFDFLRRGARFSDETDEAGKALLDICEHNVKDICGLASLFRAFTGIAAAPLEASQRFRCDAENLAMAYRRAFRPVQGELRFVQGESRPSGEYQSAADRETAARLLETAARQYPRSCLRLAFDLRRRGRDEESRQKLEELRNWPGTETLHRIPAPGGIPSPAGGKLRQGCPAAVKALALRALSIDAERRRNRRDLALLYIEEALTLADSAAGGPDSAGLQNAKGFNRPAGISRGLRADLEQRKERLTMQNR